MADAKITALTTRTLSGDAAERVSRLSVRTLSAVTPGEHLSRLSVRTLSPDPLATDDIAQLAVRTLSVQTSSGEVTRIAVRTLSTFIQPDVFQDPPLPEPLITGVQVESKIALPDPPSYYHGYKRDTILSWSTIHRALSDRNGQFESPTFTWTTSDYDLRWRRLLAANPNGIINAPIVFRMISDADRRRLLTPRTMFRGIIRKHKPSSPLKMEFTAQDPLADRFSGASNVGQIPQRLVSQFDFPNCAQGGKALVQSSAGTGGTNTGYLVSAHADVGATHIEVDFGSGNFANGDQIKFAGDDTVYTVSSSSGTSTAPAAGWGLDPEVWIEISPGLTVAVESGLSFQLLRTHEVTESAGKAVPIIYGHITDRRFEGGIDQGDGQAPVLYVGDRVLDDGHVWSEFLVCGHACYAPDGRPIPMVYFWNDALENINSGWFPYLNDYPTEATSGRICAPGYDNWTSLIGPHPYVDYTGTGSPQRYTVLFLRGIYRDWALGITPAPPNLGGVPFCIDAYGCDTVGDGSGSLITSLPLQYLHCWKNWVVGNYKSGAWLSTQSFVDDPSVPVIDEASFGAVDALCRVRVSGGYRGDFIIAPDGQQVSVRDLQSRFNVSCDCDSGYNRKVQFFISMVDSNPAHLTGIETVTDVDDIVRDSFDIIDNDDELYNAYKIYTTQDYLGRTPSGWRSHPSTADVPGATPYDPITGLSTTEVVDVTSIAVTGAKTYAPDSQSQLYMVRCKNRPSDGEEYVQGSLTANDVYQRRLRFSRQAPRQYEFSTGVRGFNWELGQVMYLVHFGNVGGRTPRPVRIMSLDTGPDTLLVRVVAYDLTPLLDS